MVVGGGICGASALYHLAHEGWTDTVLIEKAELTSGSTWHAAGQVTHSVSSYALAEFRRYACDLYASLEAESGVATSWHQSGSLRVAYHAEEVDWLRAQLGPAEYVGNAMEWVGPRRIAALHPLYLTDGMLGAVHTADDGHVDPAGAANAMVRAARNLGAAVSRRNRVLDIRRRRDGSFDVDTEQGTVHAEHVVNAAGCYAHRVARMVGLDVPIANVLHTYLLTEPVPEFADLDRELPVVRDDYVSGYLRQEQRSGLIGIYEQSGAEAVWHDGDGPGWSLENPLFDADFDRVGPWLARAFERMPVLEPLGIKQVICGAISYPPDGEPLLGPSGVPNFWQLAGVQVGIADGPGLGRELARWMVHGTTSVSVRAYDARRFGYIDCGDIMSYGRVKGAEDHQYRHQTPLPGLERPAGRPYRTTPVYGRLHDKGAVFTQVYGWERPKWFPAAAGRPQQDLVSFRHTGWFDAVAEECRAVRERVGILDSTAFAKFDLIGPDAAAVLDRLTTNTVPAVGRIGLTYLLTPQARIESELTVTRIAADHLYLVSAAAGEGKDREFFEAHWPDGADAELVTRSMELGVLNVTGPAARRLLDRVTDADLSNEAFGWLRGRLIAVAGVPDVRALRVGFTGELGWELAPAGRRPRHRLRRAVGRGHSAGGGRRRQPCAGLAAHGEALPHQSRAHPRCQPGRGRAATLREDRQGRLRGPRRAAGPPRPGRLGRGALPLAARLSGRGSRRRRRARGRRRLRRWPRRRSGDLRRLRLPLPAGPGFRLPGARARRARHRTGCACCGRLAARAGARRGRP